MAIETPIDAKLILDTALKKKTWTSLNGTADPEVS
jgi:hypothetical protein